MSNPDTTHNQFAANVERELRDDIPLNIAGKRSLTVGQLAHLLKQAGHPALARQILGRYL
jgi:hypothetical protein